VALRDDLLPVFDTVRALIQDLGLRQHRVFLSSVPWSSGEIHLGTPAQTLTELLPRPKVRPIGETGLEVSKITPAYPGGGWAPATLLPAITAGTDAYIVVRGPDAADVPYVLTRVESHRNFGYTLHLRRFPQGEPGFD
jgi:hypothetical protein